MKFHPPPPLFPHFWQGHFSQKKSLHGECQGIMSNLENCYEFVTWGQFSSSNPFNYVCEKCLYSDGTLSSLDCIFQCRADIHLYTYGAIVSSLLGALLSEWLSPPLLHVQCTVVLHSLTILLSFFSGMESIRTRRNRRVCASTTGRRRTSFTGNQNKPRRPQRSRKTDQDASAKQKGLYAFPGN